MMREAGKALRDQRDDLIKIKKNTDSVGQNIERADKIMKEINRREFMQKGILYAIIVLLFLAILLILVIRIIR
jgi:hypothetical protein